MILLVALTMISQSLSTVDTMVMWPPGFKRSPGRRWTLPSLQDTASHQANDETGAVGNNTGLSKDRPAQTDNHGSRRLTVDPSHGDLPHDKDFKEDEKNDEDGDKIAGAVYPDEDDVQRLLPEDIRGFRKERLHNRAEYFHKQRIQAMVGRAHLRHRRPVHQREEDYFRHEQKIMMNKARKLPGDGTYRLPHGSKQMGDIFVQGMKMFKAVLPLIQNSAEYIDMEEVENTNSETRHVFFLKVHKATSTTVFNILYRFALKRHLTLMLPRKNHVFSQQNQFQQSYALPLPVQSLHYDILCNHLVFGEAPVRASLPSDTKFIAIIREPFQQFVSAFRYYRDKLPQQYLEKIPGLDPIATYLSSPHTFEAKSWSSSFTHNRMSFDFGMDVAQMNNESYIWNYISYLNRTFDLVMVSERFDESMVMLKRALDWRLQDILYIRNNAFNGTDTKYTSEQMDTHRQFNLADYTLYDFFSKLFQTKTEAQGPLFAKEVAAFVSLRETVQKNCKQASTGGGFTVTATDWTPDFAISHLDCKLMVLPEVPFVALAKHLQYRRQFIPPWQRQHRRFPFHHYR